MTLPVLALAVVVLLPAGSTSALPSNQFGPEGKWHDSFCTAVGRDCQTGDFNGDGRDDVIGFVKSSLLDSSQGDVRVALSNGANGFGVSNLWNDNFCTGSETCDVGDFNGDGRDDIVSFGTGDAEFNETKVALSSGSTFVSALLPWRNDFCVANAQEVCGVGDFNGDGKDDVVRFRRGTSGASEGDVLVALSTGSAFSAPVKRHDFFCISQEVCVTGDFNDDGKDDIGAFTRDSPGSGVADVWVSLSNGTSFGTSKAWNSNFCLAGETCGTGDFNGDGRDDVIAFTKSTQLNDNLGDVKVSLSNGSTAFAASTLWQPLFCIGNQACGVGDFDGNGAFDVVRWVLDTQSGTVAADVYVALSQALFTPTPSPTAVVTTAPPTTAPATTVPVTASATATATSTATATVTPCPTVSPTSCEVFPTLSGTPTATATPTATPCPTISPTNCDLTSSPTPTPTVTPTITPTITPNITPGPFTDILVGDIDGDRHITARDSIDLLLFLAGLPILQIGGQTPAPSGAAFPPGFEYPDIDGDGHVNPLDSLAIVRGIVGLPTCLRIVGGCPKVGMHPPTDADPDLLRPLRIGSFNIKRFPGLEGNNEEFGYSMSDCSDVAPGVFCSKEDDDTARPLDIANRIKAADYDVVAFEEVWDETSKDEFVRHLVAQYPYYVRELDCTGLNCIEDSGLMLFSKWPFAPLPDDKWAGEDVDANVRNPGEYVAFRPYDACNDYSPHAVLGFGDDCQSAKGVGLVRICQSCLDMPPPASQTYFNVAFTHTQSPYSSDYCDQLSTTRIQTKQLEQAERIIRETIEGTTDQPTMLHLADEVTFFVGDMNIEGDRQDTSLAPDESYCICDTGGLECQCADGYFAPTDPPFWVCNCISDNSCKPVAEIKDDNRWVWSQNFGDGKFFGTVLHDGWLFDMPESDRGFTTGTGRIDYILHSVYNDGKLCVQQMKVAYNALSEAPFTSLARDWQAVGTRRMSDHNGIAADINQRYAYCNPEEAFRVSHLLPNTLDTKLRERIAFPGSMQWFRVEEAGTYSIAIPEGDGVLADVYSAGDLSRPLASVHVEQDTVEGCDCKGVTYHIPTGPFYIRIYNPSRQWAGSYALYIHPCDGASIRNACLLEPDIPEDHALQLPGASKWFEIPWQPATSEDAQSLRFFSKTLPGLDSCGHLDLSFQTADGHAINFPVETRLDPTDAGTITEAVVVEKPSNERIYMLVSATDLTCFLNFSVGWETNLNVIHGSRGTSLSDETGPAKLILTVKDGTDLFVDDSVVMFLTVDDVPVSVDGWYLGEFDSKQSSPPLDCLLDGISFVHSALLVFVDRDSTSANDRFPFQLMPIPDRESRSWNLHPSQHERGGSAGTYSISYNLSRYLPPLLPGLSRGC